MQPFPVYCETCGARLKVRDPNLVGQIHACPKCDSMVMIAAPATWGAAEASPASTPAPISANGPMAPANFAGEIDHLLDPPPPSKSTPVESTLHADPATAAEPQAAEFVAPAPNRTAILIWGTAGAVAFFAVGVLGAAWWNSGNEPEPNIAQTQITAGEPASVIDPPRRAGGKSTKTIETKSQLVEVNKPQIEDSSAPSEPPASEPSSAEPSPDQGSPAAVAPPALPELPALPASSDEIADEPISDSEPLPPLDPLAIDSANLDLLLVPKVRAAEVDAPLEETLPVDTTDDPETPQVAIAPRAPRRYEPGSSSRGPSFAEAFAAGELESLLAMKLPSVRWQAAALHQALAELSRLAGVPITLDPAALRMAAVSANQPVSITKENATAQELAAAIAATVKLDVANHGHGLQLIKPGADKVRKIDYRVDDLIPNSDAESFAELIQKFVAPGTWSGKIKITANSLAIEQLAAVQYEMLIFCERLRKARGLATRSRYPRALVQVEPRLAALDTQLSRSTTFAFVDWTPLVEVFGYWQDTSGVVMLVDWRGLADQDQRPLATMAGSVNNVRWADALDVCLAPLDLDWTPVDGRTIQITTRDRAAETAWVEFYPAADADKLREQIAEACDAPALDTLRLASDPSGKFVIVRGNRYIHKAATAGRGAERGGLRP